MNTEQVDPVHATAWVRRVALALPSETNIKAPRQAVWVEAQPDTPRAIKKAIRRYWERVGKRLKLLSKGFSRCPACWEKRIAGHPHVCPIIPFYGDTCPDCGEIRPHVCYRPAALFPPIDAKAETTDWPI